MEIILNERINDLTLKSVAFISDDQYNALVGLAAPERWDRNDNDIPNYILLNYILHTFKRLVYEYSKDKNSNTISETTNGFCFNTGLFTSQYKPIYAVFRKKTPTSTSKYRYNFVGFFPAYDKVLYDFDVLPNRATYFNDISELIYNPKYELIYDAEHILIGNIGRFPSDIDGKQLIVMIEGAIKLALRRVEANYRTAVPTWHRGNVSLLLPLDLNNNGVTDLALAVRKVNESRYLAKTCLTMEMAYNDARLIAKPESDWLINAPTPAEE